MPTKKELNPSPAEVSGEGKNETISATLGKDYGTLSPNPNFDDKNVDGEHATPVRVEKAAEVQPTEVHNSAQVLKLIKEYDEAHPVSGGTKLYKHSLTLSGLGFKMEVISNTSINFFSTSVWNRLNILSVALIQQGPTTPPLRYAFVGAFPNSHTIYLYSYTDSNNIDCNITADTVTEL